MNAANPFPTTTPPFDESEQQAMVVEVAGHDVGLALRERRGFRFLAADQRFSGLDGQRFSSLQGLQRAAHRYARAVASGEGLRPSPGF